MTNRLSIALAAVLLAPLAASAAGLGRLALYSMVGEPLSAEIEIVSVLPSERDSLAAKLAPAEIYDRAHVAPIPRPEAVRVAIERKADGREVVKVSSAEPIDKPLVNLLVELSWTGGGVIRQYSFLLDSVDRRAPVAAPAPPPTAAEPPATAKPAAPAEPPLVAAPARPPELAAAKPRAAAPAPDAARRPAPAPSVAATAPGPYAVQAGDTLLKIAQAARPEGVSAAQMMVAIFRANEDAFVAGNINRLKAGSTLAIPGRDAAAAVTSDEARELIAAHSAQPETRARPGAAAPAGPSGDDIAALDRAIAESRDRAAELEKTLTELRQLIEGQDRQIAELQRELGKAPAKAAAPAQPARK